MLYSFAGFSKPAITKAEKLGISCCVLYEGGAPNLPGVLAFDAYCYREQVRLTVHGLPPDIDCTWADLLELEHPEDAATEPAVRILAERFNKELPELQSGIGQSPPPVRRAELAGTVEGLGYKVRLVLESSWAVFRAKLESWLINGSYSVIDKDFKGTMATPSVDRFSSHPGPGWEKIDVEDIPAGRNALALYFFGGDIEAVLRNYAADQASPINLSHT